MRLAVIVALAIVVSGCSSRCKDVAAARTALTARRATEDRGADVRVTIPYARADAVLAAALAAEPIAKQLEEVSLGPLRVAVPRLEARVREVRLRAASERSVGFAVTVDVMDATTRIVRFESVVEVTPQVARRDAATVLSIAVRPDAVTQLRPVLGKDARSTLAAAIERWLPESMVERVPGPVLELAAGRLATELTSGAYAVLHRTLLVRLGEITTFEVTLPQLPIADVDVRSEATALIVDIRTDLPVRARLAPRATTTDIGVEVSGSAVAELANWAIEAGHAPRWYDRSMRPRADGEFRPRFDYDAADPTHPFKVYAFQERGGCSYFRVGVAARLAVRGDRLEATALDRRLERKLANPAIEALAWAKYFLLGSLDRSKSTAATTRVTVAGRVLETRVLAVAIEGHALRVALGVDVPVSDKRSAARPKTRLRAACEHRAR